MDSNSRPAAHGWTWIADAWTLFTRAPGPWILVAVVFAVVFIAMNFVPVIGPLAGIVLTPVFVGGVMLGCRRLHEGGMLEVGDLFAGFRTRLGALAALGAFSLVVSAAIVFVAGLITGFSLFALGANPDPAAIAAALVSILLTLLIVTALMLPLAMALWFAPPLVVFQGKGAFEAMAQSFVACLQNMLPFLVYGLILLVPSILATIPVGLGWLVLGPVVAASIYTAYRDIFPS